MAKLFERIKTLGRPTRARALVATAALTVIGAGSAGAVIAATPAHADTTICAQYGSTVTASGYIAQNNEWNDTTTQCIAVSGDGFKITQADHNKATNGAPAAYPSIYRGCHYGNCTSGFSPIEANTATFRGIDTSVNMSYPSSGTYDAAYDIWFDPTPRTNGQNTGAEIMVWINHTGAVQPVGSQVGTVSLNGTTWNVWEGNIGWNVISYVRQQPTTSASFPVSSFFDDAVHRGYAQTAWYLTSVQAGFEPWVGGTGLAVTNFAVTRGTSSSPTPTPSSTPTSTTTPSPAQTPTPTPSPTPTQTPTQTSSGAKSCAATYSVVTDWGSGFQGDVVVKNTGSSTLNGWAVTWTFGNGQQITDHWNAATAQSGSSVTALNMSYNGTLAPGASTDFGFLASENGGNSKPMLTCVAG